MEKNMDLYLFIPIDLKNFDINKIQTTKTEIGDFLIKQVELNNKNEFKNDYVKCLERIEIGKFTFYFQNLCEEGTLAITRHPKTNLGVLSIFIPYLKSDPSWILSFFIASKFSINDETITEWTNKNHINLIGTAKSLLFSFSPLEEEEMISILACEYSIGKLKGKEFIDAIHTDIAQYKSAKVYCSENVLLELQNVPINDIKERITMEAVEIFFMELLLLQDAAISRICDKILAELEIENNNPLKTTNTDILDVLATELSQSILFLDFNSFIYPTVRISAEKIAKNLRLDKLFEKYNTYKDLLESLISIRKNRVEDLETNNMNILLLILTMTQIIPVFIDLFKTIVSRPLAFEDIVSFISSITVCFILIFVFRLINKKKKREYKEKLMNLKF